MKLIGLTGGVGTGKSTVAKMLQDFGHMVIDADQFAREVIETGTFGFRAVVENFGPEILEKGEISRPKLREIIFKDSEKRRLLERITHPLVQWRSLQEIQFHKAMGARTLVYDVPLLFEKGYKGRFQSIIVVACDPEEQLSRVRKRDNCTVEQARNIIQSQMPLETKKANADFVIDNSGTLSNLKAQIAELAKKI